MDIEEILDDYRNGDEDQRLGLFLSYREFREEFSRIDQDKAVDHAGILWSPPFFHGKMMQTLLTLFAKGFRRPKSCCCGAIVVGRPR